MPTKPKKCTNCASLNTSTHYQHIDPNNNHYIHWDVTPSPEVREDTIKMEEPNPRPTGVPEPQPCPDPCSFVCDPVFTLCLDCGNIEPY